ncbi:MAG: hypothetical protein ACYTGH_03405 [Planctomycetota bacterium]|jgi:hypothetical protein
MRTFLHLLLILSLFSSLPLGAGEMALDEGDELTLEDVKRYTEAEVLDLIKKAYEATDADGKRKQLLAILTILVEQKDLIIQPRELFLYRNALFAQARPEDLKPWVSPLLEARDADGFDVAAAARLNLGIQIASVVGGAPFPLLQSIYAAQKDRIDLEWMLPALGRAGGEKALPLIQPHRRDKVIIPLNNYQNIRKVPSAAVLGCAYAGDRAAEELILSWYEADSISRPRFAFYISWAKGLGQKITPSSYALLDHCQHRINQAERYLSFKGKRGLADLIERANRTLSLSLIEYLVRNLSSLDTKAGDDALAAYLPLLRNPSLQVRYCVLDAITRGGTPALQTKLWQRIGGLLKGKKGNERFFAFSALLQHRRTESAEPLQAALAAEPNAALKSRMQRLMIQRTTLAERRQ